MKARYLIFISMLSVSSSVLALDQSIIDEALKATPAGFTDLVPRRSFPTPVIKQARAVNRIQLTPVDFNNPTSASPAENVEHPTNEADSILKAHHEENEAFIRRLSKVLQTPQ